MREPVAMVRDDGGRRLTFSTIRDSSAAWAGGGGGGREDRCGGGGGGGGGAADRVGRSLAGVVPVVPDHHATTVRCTASGSPPAASASSRRSSRDLCGGNMDWYCATSSAVDDIELAGCVRRFEDWGTVVSERLPRAGARLESCRPGWGGARTRQGVSGPHRRSASAGAPQRRSLAA